MTLATLPRILINALMFQVAWLACVFAARLGTPLWSVPIVAVVTALHLRLTAPHGRGRELLALLVITAVGTSVDCGMLVAGVLRFGGSTTLTAEFAVWIACFWLNFATLLNVSFRWLRPWTWRLGAPLAAISAPLTYYGGEKLGALELGQPLLGAMTAIGIEWALLFPLAVLVAARVTERNQRGVR